MIVEPLDNHCCLQDEIAVRSPNNVMRLEALGASFAHRLSFKRTLIRALHKQQSSMRITKHQLDQNGFGHVVLTIDFYGRDYSLIAYSRALADEDRTDRVIATAWDASFCLFEGVPDDNEIARLSEEVTHQEAGIYHEKILTLSRANKSVRLFAHVVDALAGGQQPDIEAIAKIGYLMRTTAVYGNGKFGIADRDLIKTHPGFDGPFRAEMLTVFLIREFTFVLADHLAKIAAPKNAICLSPAIKRHLGVGNSTGLGMAPFLIHHPNLLHSWMLVRETAIAQTRQIANIDKHEQARYLALGKRVAAHLAQWQVDDVSYQKIIKSLILNWQILSEELADYLAGDMPFDRLMRYADDKGDDFSALMASFITEYQSELLDGLEDCMTQAREPEIEPAMTLGTLSKLIETHYQWALQLDLSDPEMRQQFWYVSEEKLEPRLGDARTEDGQDKEMPFAMAFYIDRLRKYMADKAPDMVVAELLLAQPELRFIIRRVQNVAHFPYAEIRGNLVGASCRPIDLLRCKLSYFGASKFDPRSDRWTRITMFQGAPCADELLKADADDWSFWVIGQPDQDSQQIAKSAH